MKAICIKTTSEGFDLTEVKTVLSNEFDYTYGGYGIELGKEYIIMGVALYNDSNVLYYLIDVYGEPDWFPYLLFNISDSSLPGNWHMRVNEKKTVSAITCLWGFEELSKIEDFNNRLIEGEEEAMRIYFRRKIQFENEYDTNNE